MMSLQDKLDKLDNIERALLSHTVETSASIFISCLYPENKKLDVALNDSIIVLFEILNRQNISQPLTKDDIKNLFGLHLKLMKTNDKKK